MYRGGCCHYVHSSLPLECGNVIRFVCISHFKDTVCSCTCTCVASCYGALHYSCHYAICSASAAFVMLIYYVLISNWKFTLQLYLQSVCAVYANGDVIVLFILVGGLPTKCANADR